MELKKAVCMHEEDAGLLWKHMEYRNGHAESRRWAQGPAARRAACGACCATRCCRRCMQGRAL